MVAFSVFGFEVFELFDGVAVLTVAIRNRQKQLPAIRQLLRTLPPFVQFGFELAAQEGQIPCSGYFFPALHRFYQRVSFRCYRFHICISLIAMPNQSPEPLPATT